MILGPATSDAPPITMPAGLPVGFYAEKARSLAQMVVLGVDSPGAIAAYFGLTPAQWDTFSTSFYFKQVLLEAQNELKDANLPVEKARAMARLASPDAIATLLSLSRNSDDLKVGRDAAETILNIAGIQTKTAVAQSQGGPTGIAINISFAAPTQPAVQIKTTDREVIEHE